jgi:hypothetical protein
MVPKPSENVTVPVGVPVPLADEIVAVKVTGALNGPEEVD